MDAIPPAMRLKGKRKVYQSINQFHFQQDGKLVRRVWIGSWPFGHQRSKKGVMCLPERMFWNITRNKIIFRNCLLNYIE